MLRPLTSPRSRVYDALNVLEAVGILAKDKKTVRWVGFPQESQVSGLSFLTQERDEARQRVRDKVAKLKALLGQQIAYHQLISRNKAAVEAAVAAAPTALGTTLGTTLETMRQTESPLPQASPPLATMPDVPTSSGGHVSTMPDVSTPPTAAAAAAAAASDASDAAAAAAAAAAALGATATDAEGAASSSSSAAAEAGAGSPAVTPAVTAGGSSSDGARALSQRISMPFLLVSTRRPSAIDCALSDDRTRAMLTFEDAFRIHDDTQVMRRLGLHLLPAADRRSLSQLSQLLGRVEPRLRAELVRFHLDGSLPAAVPPAAAIAAAFNSFNSPLPPPPPPPLPLPPLSTVAAPALAASMFAAPAPGAEPSAIAATAQAPPPPLPPPPP